MTINQLMECLLGKSCVMLGEYGDCTPFGSNSIDVVDKLCDKLGKTGHDRLGWETLTNGMTGEKIPAKIFMGPTYYQRLKHMVGDKLHSRAHGPVTMLTRQPLEGRSRAGGLRFGDSLISPSQNYNFWLVCNIAGNIFELRGILVGL